MFFWSYRYGYLMIRIRCENCDKILSFVLGEGNKLLGIFMDKDLEFLFFFIIFCGKCRIDNKDGKILLLYSIVVK